MVHGCGQLFVKRCKAGQIIYILAKKVDYFLMAGTTEVISEFLLLLNNEFKVGMKQRDGFFTFNGCEIWLDTDECATLSMDGYIERLKEVELSRARRKDRTEKVTAIEEHNYRSLAGTMMYLGSAVVLQAVLATSFMQERLANLRVANVLAGNEILRDILALKLLIMFPAVANVIEVRVMTMSDASHGSAMEDYGQKGGLTSLLIKDKSGEVYFHIIDWCSHKQKRIFQSSFGAEIMSCGDNDDRGYDLNTTFGELFPRQGIRHEVLVDSPALFHTIKTLHDNREYRLGKIGARISNAFESGELDQLR